MAKRNIPVGLFYASYNSNCTYELNSRTVENGQNLTNIYLNGDGDITKEDIDRELDRLFKEYDIDKNDSTINIEMEINR